MTGLSRKTLFLLLTGIVGSFSSEVAADLYVCKTPKGTLKYTNAPNMSTCQKFRGKRGGGIMAYYEGKKVRKKVKGNYDKVIANAAKKYSLDPSLIRAVIRVESDFDRYAVSKMGARGLMQLMPDTARTLRVRNSFDPEENIYGGTKYLRSLYTLFEGDLKLTLAAYNAGPTLVKKIKRIPRIPETVNYVRQVLYHYRKYKGKRGFSDNSIKVRDLRMADAR